MVHRYSSAVRKGRDEVGLSIGTAAQSERSFVSTALQTVANDNAWYISHSLRKGLECPVMETGYCCCRLSPLGFIGL